MTSAGLGDRLGQATPGHVRAFRRHGGTIAAIFAQQSIREMQRTQRTPQQVLDDATFGCVEEGWDRPVGADADHLKSTEDVDRCLEAGFTFFTLDPGDYVSRIENPPSRKDIAALPWDALHDARESLLRRYTTHPIDLGDEHRRIGEEEILTAAAKYAAAIVHAAGMYRHLLDHARHPVEVEISVDETEQPTTVVEHVYMATELARLGVDWVSFAPRYIGRFEKAIDYVGDPEVFYTSMVQHARVSRALGPYKLSLHSGSDKFSIYEAASAATQGLVHLKTAGTSYLEALYLAAAREPVVFREIYGLSREAYRGARASYHVSARLATTPNPHDVNDAELPELLNKPASRQILHVGFGAVLTSTDSGGRCWLADALHAIIEREAENYAMRLERHLGRHLQPFAGAA